MYKPMTKLEKAVAAVCLVVTWTVIGLSCARADVLDDWDFYGELGVGANQSWFQSSNNYEWDNEGWCAGFLGKLSAEKSINQRLTFVGQYLHVSHWNCGPPFNDNAESSLDHVGIALRFRLGGT